jgi:hypothetical protein
LRVFIRVLLMQLETPDEIRGRVNAVNSVFIGRRMNWAVSNPA